MVPHCAPWRLGGGAGALQARRIPLLIGRDVWTRPIDTEGPGWKILDSHSDARGPGGGWAVRAAARDPGQRPAAGPGPPNPLGENFGRPKNCNPAWPQIALRDTRRISAQGELLLPVYDGPRASGQRALRAARPRRLPAEIAPATALDATARLRGAAPRLACGPPVDIECGRWRGRPSGPGPIRWRRRAAPLRFAAGRLKP